MDDQAPVPQEGDAQEQDGRDEAEPEEAAQGEPGLGRAGSPKALRRKRTKRRPRVDSDPSARELMARAHEMWVVHLASASEIEAQCGVSRFTLRNWREAGGWDREREQADHTWISLTSALRGQLADLSAQLAQAEGRTPERQMELNALIRQALDNSRRTRELRQEVEFRSQVFRVMRGLMAYLRSNDLELAQSLIPHLKPFMAGIMGLEPTKLPGGR